MLGPEAQGLYSAWEGAPCHLTGQLRLQAFSALAGGADWEPLAGTHPQFL